ncbi:hypothetical protein NZD88_01460 [Chryseobacterium antibioticum]|uniref:Uncharacterized protein n=1 Tax=Chryseobacterium pyrolae TaxID=2987481 RepID=A0ABT2IC71_9FLAO|nr:hypothetical protein [Chryseobacterium pyrolae]MCT2406221.1 hypothetical protein [Chryseobacterium pyrolae]
MDIKDLRIGNTFLFVNFEATILGIVHEDVIIKYNNKIEDVIAKFMIQGVSPLNLTEKHLFRLGFKLMPETEYTTNTYELEGFQIWDKNGDFTELLYLSNRESVHVKYVHQLQNLFFALKGKELTIK